MHGTLPARTALYIKISAGSNPPNLAEIEVCLDLLVDGFLVLVAKAFLKGIHAALEEFHI